MSPSTALSAYKRAPSLEISQWHLGNLVTYLADASDTNGAYCLMEVLLQPGNEPPPHVHTREDELFYVIEGNFDAFAGEERFSVGAGGCVFLPRLKPHAFIVRSPELRMLALFSPGGIEEAFRVGNAPAKHLGLPENAITHSTANIEETARRMSGRGVRLLMPDEIENQLPSYHRMTSRT